MLLFLPTLSFANTNSIPLNQENCIDLEEIYKQINKSSQAVTGVDNSIDAVKKVNTVASLMNVISLFLGEQIYCVKDEEAALQSNTLKSVGLFGVVNNGTNALIGMYPDINVSDHLATMFVPGYKENNTTFAQTIIDPGDLELGGNGTAQNDAKKRTTNIIEKAVKPELEKTVQQYSDSIKIEEINMEETPTPSISGYNYLKDVVHLDKIWRSSLNIVYLFSIIIFIIVGFMIMFRKNLPGNTTVTVSKALPQIIISLVLATFSFAIVGIIMDLGKVGINLSRSIISNIYVEMGEGEEKIIEQKNLWSLADDVFQKTRLDTDAGDALSKIPLIGDTLAGVLVGKGNTLTGELARVGAMGATYYFLQKNLPEIVNEADVDASAVVGIDFGISATVDIVEPVLDFAEWTLKNLLYIGMTAASTGLMAIIIKSLILIIICFYAAFKVFLTLLTTYLKLFINVIVAPFQLMLGAIPGNGAQITNWLKSVVANTLVFVGVFVVINIFTLISTSIDPARFNFYGNDGVLWPDILVSLQSIIVIAGYLFAANLPKVINNTLGVGNDKGMIAASESMKQTAKKIPLIGGMFN